jgi:hypothetical protein
VRGSLLGNAATGAVDATTLGAGARVGAAGAAGGFVAQAVRTSVARASADAMVRGVDMAGLRANVA